MSWWRGPRTSDSIILLVTWRSKWCSLVSTRRIKSDSSTVEKSILIECAPKFNSRSITAYLYLSSSRSKIDPKSKKFTNQYNIHVITIQDPIQKRFRDLLLLTVLSSRLSNKLSHFEDLFSNSIIYDISHIWDTNRCLFAIDNPNLYIPYQDVIS